MLRREVFFNFPKTSAVFDWPSFLLRIGCASFFRQFSKYATAVALLKQWTCTERTIRMYRYIVYTENRCNTVIAD